MTAPVSYTATGRIGNIVIDSPPVNALSHGVRQGIVECLKVAEADDTEVVILRCEGRTFIAGADITEFGKPPQAPTLALANEGARILEEGIAQRASDIDVVYCHGYGFPRFRGGPMHAAEALGLHVVAERIAHFQQTLNPDNWALAPLLERLASNGGSLKDAS